MRVITAEQVAETLEQRDFVEALREGFRSPVTTPLRHQHVVERPDGADNILLLMPAWTDFPSQGHSQNGYCGIKLATVAPDNESRGTANIQAAYILLDGVTGEPLALIDGEALTFQRTSAASALAADYLARKDARRLVMVGAGGLAPWLVGAHAAVRPIEQVVIWNRTPGKARDLAAQLGKQGFAATATEDLATAAGEADIICAATLTYEPLIQGEWLRPGVHVDLVGGFRPDMREADDEAIRRASVFVDTRTGALAESGDIIQPIDAGVMSPDDVRADLFDLVGRDHPGRTSDDEITLFKSVGTALEDLAGAVLIADRC